MSSKTKTTTTEEETTPTLVPKLRFPEFRGTAGWKTKSLGDVCKLYQSETIASSEFVADGEYFVYGANGVVGRLDRYNHEHEEVAVSCRGNCGEVHLTKPKSWITGNAMVVSPKIDDLTKQFLFRLLGAANLKPVISGSAQPQITRQGFSPFEVSIPVPAEQKKIAECLSSVDELIAAQARKVDALKTHKKGLMQQLFPREGETQPRLRFPEFENAGEWEDTTLGQLAKLVRGPFGGSLKKEIFVASGYAVYEQQHAIYSDFSSFRYHITAEKFHELRRFAVAANDIIMSCSGTMGKFAIIPDGAAPGVINQALLKLTTNSSCDTRFLKAVLELPSVQEKLLSQSAGGAIQNVVSVDQIKALPLRLPSGDEQQAVVDCLSSLDALITAETQKLEALKTHKKGLMQQLFPSPEEVEA